MFAADALLEKEGFDPGKKILLRASMDGNAFVEADVSAFYPDDENGRFGFIYVGKATELKPVIVKYADIKSYEVSIYDAGAKTTGTGGATVISGVAVGTSGSKTRSCEHCGHKQTVTAKGTKLQRQNPFLDVKKSDFYYEAVLWAVEKGITSGTSATAFSPNNPCTRGQIAAFLWRAAGQPAPSTSKNPFTDVKKSDYYYQAVLWAVGKGVTSGTSKTTFSPNDPCTRGQIVTFLYRNYN